MSRTLAIDLEFPTLGGAARGISVANSHAGCRTEKIAGLFDTLGNE
jgi:hypothetical protein